MLLHTLGTAFFLSHLPFETIEHITQLTTEGTSLRATSRILQMSKATVNGVILRVGQHCMLLLSTLLTSPKLTEVQLDELWTYVYKKTTSDNDYDYDGTYADSEKDIGRTWSWTAIDAPMRLLVCFNIGGRLLSDCRTQLNDLKNRLLGKPLFTSDALEHYKTVLEEMFHTMVKVPPTGLRGRARKPRRVIDPDLDYGIAKKTRQGHNVVKVERSIICGS